jgi:hypothetical protein
MYPGEHARLRPDQPPVIMAGSGRNIDLWRIGAAEQQAGASAAGERPPPARPLCGLHGKQHPLCRSGSRYGAILVRGRREKDKIAYANRVKQQARDEGVKGWQSLRWEEHMRAMLGHQNIIPSCQERSAVTRTRTRLLTIGRPHPGASIVDLRARHPVELPIGSDNEDLVCGACGTVALAGWSFTSTAERLVVDHQMLIRCGKCRTHNVVPIARLAEEPREALAMVDNRLKGLYIRGNLIPPSLIQFRSTTLAGLPNRLSAAPSHIIT